jgi:hypothetical protein
MNKTLKQGTKHGVWGTYLYSLWKNIMNRCYNPKHNSYKNYGGRGIIMYEPWKNDKKLFFDYIINVIGHRPSPQHSIDRIDPDDNYLPGKLSWADRTQQTHNRRISKKRRA